MKDASNLIPNSRLQFILLYSVDLFSKEMMNTLVTGDFMYEVFPKQNLGNRYFGERSSERKKGQITSITSVI